jgi:cell wall-associated NlpC family hydrolase
LRTRPVWRPAPDDLDNANIAHLKAIRNDDPDHPDPAIAAAASGAVAIYRAAVKASPSTDKDPCGLKAARWAINQLGKQEWGFDGDADVQRFTRPGAHEWKCNFFVSQAYVQGAGVPWPGHRSYFHFWPAGANELSGDENVDYLDRVSGGKQTIGDVVALHQAHGYGHSGIYVGAGLMVYAGEKTAAAHTVELMKRLEGAVPVYRHYQCR